MRRLANKFTYVVTALILAVLVIFSVWGSSTLTVRAAALPYSSALDDLKRVDTFNPDEYPDNLKDYSIKVIQIAESTENELFVYTYQPSQKVTYLVATSVRISTTINDGDDLDASWQDYKLTLLNSSGVFCKYKVEGFEVKKDPVRYYDIAAIHRKWYALFDAGLSDDNTINEMVFSVAQKWTVKTENGKVVYGVEGTDVVEIRPQQKHVGFIRYPAGFKFVSSSCDSHYIAFDCDRQIDKLFEADVAYSERHVTEQYLFTALVSTSYGDEKETPKKTLNYKDQQSSNIFGGIISHTYTWDRIERADDFIKNPDNKLTDETKKALEGKKWVLRFTETEYKVSPITNGYQNKTYTEVSKVTILRLKFETNGVIYNLGVVDSKQSGDNNPDNKLGSDMPWWVWLIIILAAVVVISLLLYFFVPGAKPVFQFIGRMLAAPFKKLGELFKKLRERVRERMQERRNRKEQVRRAKQNQKDQMKVYKNQVDLQRKENKRQQKLDEKDAQKAQKAKDRQTAKRRKKAAKKRRKAAKSKNKKKGGKKK